MTRPPLALQLINRKTTKNLKKEIVGEVVLGTLGHVKYLILLKKLLSKSQKGFVWIHICLSIINNNVNIASDP